MQLLLMDPLILIPFLQRLIPSLKNGLLGFGLIEKGVQRLSQFLTICCHKGTDSGTRKADPRIRPCGTSHSGSVDIKVVPVGYGSEDLEGVSDRSGRRVGVMEGTSTATWEDSVTNVYENGGVSEESIKKRDKEDDAQLK